MKVLVLLTVVTLLSSSGYSQADTTKKEFQIKYEVLTKKGESILVSYFDKDEKNAGATASESWVYTFATSNRNQNIQISTVGGQTSRRNNGAKVWVTVNVFVNGKLIKSKEGKVLGLGPTVQVNLNDIK